MKQYLAIMALSVIPLLPQTALAQGGYPDRPIKLVVPYPPGSGTDTVARYAAKRMETALGKPVVIENKPGGNAIIAAQTVVNAPADGYTLLWAANGPVTTNVALYEKLPYNPLTDFEPVARLAYSPMGLYVPADSPYKTAADLFGDAKKRPGKLNYGSGSATYNIATEWLMSLVGAKANAISYKGSSPTLTDLAGKQVDFAIAEYSAGLPLVKGGKIRLLAMTSDHRMKTEPETPTLQELGYKEYFQVAWWGVFAPKSTPRAIVSRLESTLLSVFKDAETAQYLEQNNFSAFTGTAAQLRAFQKAEIERETSLVKRFNIPKL
ncbi:Extra-cytoplasmic solute receptor family protein 26 [Cupriavidus taiwanensis]|uniref:Bug family tripartite tricarboxylate transporter substrate binding protein n=1 Tax=Cupriavidus taiwanensis TaxID=164546 RepID=UPI000E138F04|nr:tripartite tricarboxylate transporter substrate binding protein [Cupriavidus taiwanensis]SOZ18278.1 Extra-cytoplasmic solute receptor family protein 26 [Cupriavidus taiwanensis]SOZ31240.1 Extra-cytoplasmic solute receptor family protein 26 [Cupriavidus taiwanensis]SOZ47317.1 Extra-cytoplasmic solute receptor family protein 26 [Cupriavidus taiwanensis]